MKISSLLFVPAAACALLLWSACATPAKPVPSPRAGTPFEGEYRGTWQSAGGHHGKLICRFTRLDDAHYQAHFTAWWLTFHTSYDTVFHTTRRGEELRFEGEQDLGKLRGGLYHYTGQIRHGAWQAQYAAPADHGTFTMQRE